MMYLLSIKTNEVFGAMEAIKNSLMIINDELKSLKKVDDT